MDKGEQALQIKSSLMDTENGWDIDYAYVSLH